MANRTRRKVFKAGALGDRSVAGPRRLRLVAWGLNDLTDALDLKDKSFLEAVENGDIAESRYLNYIMMLEEIEEQANN